MPVRRVTQQDCPACGAVHFRNAKPCAGAIIAREGRVLLGRRNREPYLDWWDIPGGFLEHDEHPEAGAVRELREETGIDITLTCLLGIYLDVYPYGDPTDPDTTLNLVYLATAPGGEPRPAVDAAAIGWFGPDDLPDNLAFAHLAAALADWRRVTEWDAGGRDG
jgi:8-oxo-dGTP diphosphatase